MYFSRTYFQVAVAVALAAASGAAVAQSTPDAMSGQSVAQASGPGASQASAQAMPPAPPEDLPLASEGVIRLSEVEGSVRLYDDTGKLFDQVLQNMAVLAGMSVETGNDGRAELEFPDGSVVRVTPNSKLSLSKLMHDSAGPAHLILKPVTGLTYYELAPGSTAESVQVGPLRARVPEGSAQQALLRVNLDAVPYLAAALRGTVHFEDAGGSAVYDLQASQTAKIDPAAATNYDISLDLEPDSWDSWNVDRDSVRAQIAGAAHPEGENAGPGWNDLNYYGSWYDVPGQGMAWAPDGVGESFDPYGSGAWGYYTTTGYSWASSYPWGWLPYHCGLWNNYPAYGWVWQPSGCGWGGGTGWYPYSGVGSAPYRYIRPRRPQPPQGVNHLPSRLALVPVHQGPPAHFRVVGGPRPAPRTLVVAGQTLQPVPAVVRPSYRSVVTPNGSEDGQVNGFVQPGPSFSNNGYVNQARPAAGMPGYGVTALPRVTPAPRVPTYSPPSAPHISAPPTMASPPQHIAPPPAAAPSHAH